MNKKVFSIRMRRSHNPYSPVEFVFSVQVFYPDTYDYSIEFSALSFVELSEAKDLARRMAKHQNGIFTDVIEYHFNTHDKFSDEDILAYL